MAAVTATAAPSILEIFGLPLDYTDSPGMCNLSPFIGNRVGDKEAKNNPPQLIEHSSIPIIVIIDYPIP